MEAPNSQLNAPADRSLQLAPRPRAIYTFACLAPQDRGSESPPRVDQEGDRIAALARSWGYDLNEIERAEYQQALDQLRGEVEDDQPTWRRR
jgi:hypothetical protein